MSINHTPEAIIQARREYHREWRRTHPENVAAAQLRFWTRKAQDKEKEKRTGCAGANSAREKRKVNGC